jgi:hypothetical protein
MSHAALQAPVNDVITYAKSACTGLRSGGSRRSSAFRSLPSSSAQARTGAHRRAFGVTKAL